MSFASRQSTAYKSALASDPPSDHLPWLLPFPTPFPPVMPPAWRQLLRMQYDQCWRNACVQCFPTPTTICKQTKSVRCTHFLHCDARGTGLQSTGRIVSAWYTLWAATKICVGRDVFCSAGCLSLILAMPMIKAQAFDEVHEVEA